MWNAIDFYFSRSMSEISPENDSSADLSGDDAISTSSSSNLSPLKRKWLSLSADTRDDIKTTILSFAFALFVRVVQYNTIARIYNIYFVYRKLRYYFVVLYLFVV